jgi:hypothetical protein
VMEHEIVQHDHSRPSSQRIDDPAVRLWIVADVVERNVGGDRSRASTAHDRDLDEIRERGHEQRGIVGYPRPFRRQG